MAASRSMIASMPSASAKTRSHAAMTRRESSGDKFAAHFDEALTGKALHGDADKAFDDGAAALEHQAKANVRESQRAGAGLIAARQGRSTLGIDGSCQIAHVLGWGDEASIPIIEGCVVRQIIGDEVPLFDQRNRFVNQRLLLGHAEGL